MAQEVLRRHVLRVLRAWRERFIFSDDYLNGLQATFLAPALSADALAATNPGLKASLGEAGEDELERRARLAGISTRGGKEATVSSAVGGTEGRGGGGGGRAVRQRGRVH